MITAADMLDADRVPVYLGCDVQTTGMAWAVIPVQGDAVVMATGWLPFPMRDELEAAAVRAVHSLDGRLRVAGNTGVRPYSVAVERVGGGRGVQSMLAVANAAGVVAGVLASRYDTATMWRPTPAEWKRLAGLSGNAGKPAVMDRAVDIIRAGRAYVTVPDMRQDIADAVCIAYADREAGRRAVAGEG